jgi:hypothetical protein
MKIKLDRIISIATLLASVVAIFLVLKKPAPVPASQTPATAAERAQSSDPRPDATRQTEQPAPTSSFFGSSSPAPTTATYQPPAPATSGSKAEPRINSEEVSAAVAKMLGGGSASPSSLSPDANVGGGEPAIKDQQVTMDGDIVHGKFLTTIAGKDVWVTVSGHMGEKDGYATFDPTEFKVGDTEVPVSLVNPLLQRKLAEERDRLKIPNN